MNNSNGIPMERANDSFTLPGAQVQPMEQPYGPGDFIPKPAVNGDCDWTFLNFDFDGQEPDDAANSIVADVNVVAGTDVNIGANANAVADATVNLIAGHNVNLISGPGAVAIADARADTSANAEANAQAKAGDSQADAQTDPGNRRPHALIEKAHRDRFKAAMDELCRQLPHHPDYQFNRRRFGPIYIPISGRGGSATKPAIVNAAIHHIRSLEHEGQRLVQEVVKMRNEMQRAVEEKERLLQRLAIAEGRYTQQPQMYPPHHALPHGRVPPHGFYPPQQ